MNDNSNNQIIEISKTNSFSNCYICYENCLIKSPCNCKNIFIHKECQKKYIETSNNFKCSICNTQYDNLYYKVNINKKITTFGIIFIINGLFIITLSSSGILFIYFFYNYNNNFYFIIGTIVIIISLLLLIKIIHIKLTNNNNLQIFNTNRQIHSINII